MCINPSSQNAFIKIFYCITLKKVSWNLIKRYTQRKKNSIFIKPVYHGILIKIPENFMSVYIKVMLRL